MPASGACRRTPTCYPRRVSRLPPSLAFDAVIEERIQEAMRRGDFDNLPGAGRPLDLDDDRLVPPELRIAFRVLKNAGLAPPEVLVRREIAALEAVLDQIADAAERKRTLAKLAVLRTQLGVHRAPRRAASARRERTIVARLADG